jgi:O-antigen/teichoic acid export membrane protein
MDVGFTLQHMQKSWTSLRTLLLGDGSQASLRQRALGSGIWVGGGFAAQKLLQFGSNLILTRLLFPEAFGLMALAMVFLVGLQMFSDIGIKPSIIRDSKGDDPAFLNTAWTIQVIRGFLLCFAAMAMAYPISLLYKEPILFPLLVLLSSIAAISGFNSISMATAERNLDFRMITLLQLTAQIISVVLLIIMVFFWRSVWALAVANVIGSFLSVVMGFVFLRGHKHRFSIDKTHAKSLISFGKWIFLSTVATYLGGEGLRAAQAGYLTATEFGILSIAYMMAAAPNELIVRLSGSVGLPVVAEAYRSDPAKAKAILSAFRKRILLLSMVTFGAIIFASTTLVQVLYDVRYHDAGRYLALLSLVNALAIIGAGYLSALLAIGKSKEYFLNMLAIALIRLVAVALGYQYGNIEGMIAGMGVANMLMLLITFTLAYRLKVIDLKLDFLAILLFSSILITYLAVF